MHPMVPQMQMDFLRKLRVLNEPIAVLVHLRRHKPSIRATPCNNIVVVVACARTMSKTALSWLSVRRIPSDCIPRWYSPKLTRPLRSMLQMQAKS